MSIRSQVSRISKHLRKWNLCSNSSCISSWSLSKNNSSSRWKISHHSSNIFFWSHNFYRHDRFKDRRWSLHKRFLECLISCYLKRYFWRIHIMIRTKEWNYLNIDDWESSKDTLCHSFFCSLINRRDKFVRDHTSLNFRYKFIVFIFRKLFKSKLNISKLTSTSSLLFEDSSCWSSIKNCFSVCYLWFTSIYLYFMFSSKSIYDHIKMKFSHTSNNSLSTFFIRICLERWIFLHKLWKRKSKLFLISLWFWFNSNLDHWIREFHFFKNDWFCRITKSMSCLSFLKTKESTDISSRNLWNFFSLICMHKQKSSNSFFLFSHWIKQSISRLNNSRIYSHESQSTNERISHDLESNSWNWFIKISFSNYCFIFLIWIVTYDLTSIKWRWQEINHRIENKLNSLISKSCSTKHWIKFIWYNSLSNCFFDQFIWNFFSSKEFFSQFIIKHRDCINHSFSILLCLILHISWNFSFNYINSLFSLKVISLHSNQINHSFKGISLSNRKLNRDCLIWKSLSHRFNRHKEICSHLIHLIYKDKSWYSILISLSPNSFSLRLSSLRTIKQCNSTIQNSKRSLYLNSKVYVSRSINHINLIIMPKTSSRSRSNGNTSLLFLFHPVHISSSIVSFTDLVLLSCIIQNSLSCSGLTGINMSHNTNVPYLIQRFFVICHNINSIKYKNLNGLSIKKSDLFTSQLSLFSFWRNKENKNQIFYLLYVL